MPKPLSDDLRQRLVNAVAGGMSCNGAARRFGVSISSAIRIVGRWRGTGSWAPKQMGGYKQHRLADHLALVETILAEKADITLAELQARLAAAQIEVSQTSITRFLHHAGYRYKKNGTRQRTGS
jgi:putative transposase